MIRLPRLYRQAEIATASGASGRSGAEAAAAQAVAFPPALTGGESSQRVQIGIRERVKVDWLTYTFETDADVRHDLEVLDLLRDHIGPVEAVSCAGMLGYDHGVRYFVTIDGSSINVGRLDWGGNHHKGRGRFDLSGTGCAKVHDWRAVQAFIGRQFAVKLTRVDLACDLLDGQLTVEDAVEWYQAGDFNAGGRNPRHSMPGDWLNPVYGRTFEVGRRTNGKMLRAYEKGRQLGDPDSAWTRFEVEFRNIDRDLPLDILTDCDSYFAGAYRCLSRVVAALPVKVPTHQREGEITLAALVEHARTAYGRCINVLRLHMSAEDVVSSLTVNGVPARLEKSAVGGFLPELLQRRRT